jgi:O-antigen/teichoic acid export membrane protein
MDSIAPSGEWDSPLRGSGDGGLAAGTIRGVGWSAVTTTVRQVVLFASQIVLARILIPRDFGVMGMVLVFGNLAAVLVDSGYGAALVQRQRVEDRHLRTVFSVSTLSGVVIAASLAVLSGWLAGFFNEPRVQRVALIISLSFVLTSVAVVWDALAYRMMRFRLLAVVDISATVVGAAVAIGCALAGLGATSLAIQVVTYSAVRLVLLGATATWAPSFGGDFVTLRELSRFSLSLLGFNVLNFAARSADNLLIGRELGSESLGYYSRAYNLMLLPAMTVVSVVSRVMFPSLSRMDAAERVRRVYLESLGAIALVAAPLSIGLFVSARELVETIFGPRWSPAVPVVRVLALVSLVQTFQTTTGWIFASRGRTDLQLRWGLCAIPIILAGFVVGVMAGSPLAVAESYFITTVIILGYPSFAVPGRLIGMKVSDVVRATGGPIGSSLCMGASVLAIRQLAVGRISVSAAFFLELFVGALVYCALVRSLRLQSLQALASRIPPSVAVHGIELRRVLVRPRNGGGG